MSIEWCLRPDVLHLNHGSFGACPRAVLAAQQAIRERLEAQPMHFLLHELEERLDAARRVVAELVGADPSCVVFVPNATTGVNAVLRSFPFSPGDEILVTDHSYHACANAAHYVAERAGANVVCVPIPFPGTDAEEVCRRVVDAIGPNTRLLLLDHVTSATALVFPVAEIAREAKTRGIDLMLDGAHAPGMLPLDLEQLARDGVTYYTGNLHKWVCGPKGSAFLYVRPDRQQRVRPTTISHGADTRRIDRSRFLVEFDWVGTTDPSAYLAVPAALEVLSAQLEGGMPALMTRNREGCLEARRSVADALQIPLPAPDSMLGSIASLPLPDARGPAPLSSNDRLQDELVQNENIQTVIPIWPRWPKRLVRISFHLYNSLDDYRRLATALVRALEREAGT